MNIKRLNIITIFYLALSVLVMFSCEEQTLENLTGSNLENNSQFTDEFTKTVPNLNCTIKQHLTTDVVENRYFCAINNQKLLHIYPYKGEGYAAVLNPKSQTYKLHSEKHYYPPTWGKLEVNEKIWTFIPTKRYTIGPRMVEVILD